MAMRSRQGYTGKAELQQYEFDLKAGEQYTLELEGPEDTESAFVVVESEAGELSVDVDEAPAENLSRYKRARLFLLRGASSFTLTVRNTVGTRIRASVAFVRREITEALAALPCRTCTLALGIVVSAVCAGLGVPLFDVPETIEMPAPEIDTRLITRPMGLEDLGVDPDGATIEIENESPIAQFTEEQQTAMRDLQGGRGPLAYLHALVEATDSRLYAKLVAAFEAVNWVFRLRQRLYKNVCAQAGFCHE